MNTIEQLIKLNVLNVKSNLPLTPKKMPVLDTIFSIVKKGIMMRKEANFCAKDVCLFIQLI